MIRPLRQRHRRTIIALGIVTSIAFGLGTAARRPVPAMDALPAGVAPSSHGFEATGWERADLFVRYPIRVRLFRDGSNAGRFGVGFSAAKDFLKPDLLVYWVAGNPNLTDTVPDDARLLGSFGSSRPLALPAEADTQAGVLVLYSLADGEIVDVSRSVQFNNSTK